MAPRKERNTSITVGNITLNEEDLKILNNNDLLNDKVCAYDKKNNKRN